MKDLKLFLGFTAFAAGLRWLLREMNKQELHGKVALVTGSSRGLGLLLARELGREGCRVVICARDKSELEEAGKRLSDWGVHDVFAVQCDVGEEHQVQEMLNAVQDELGPIDLLVNNAGIIQTGPIESQRISDFRSSLDTIFWGSLYTSMTLLPLMLERNAGHIVNITSVGGKVAVPHLLPYGTAKFAALGFSEGLAAEVMGTNVHVTTVVPGLMRTGSYLNAFFKGDHEPEFMWFGISDNLPFLSMDAERAARRIVSAIKHKETEIVLTLPAKLLVWMHGLFPSLTIKLLGFFNQVFLPEGEDPDKLRGKAIQRWIDSPLFFWLTAWGRSAARRFNQYQKRAPHPEPTEEKLTF